MEFSSYRIVRKLAVGGMAEIYLARQSSHAGFERELVIKRILPEFSADAEFVRSFLNEAKLAARLNHPNIVQIYDLGKSGNYYYLTMEYIRGYDLAAVLAHHSALGSVMPLGVALRILGDVCAGLHHAHEARDIDGHPLDIVHRDVTPSNVIVSVDGITKLVDFGIAKANARSGQEKTRTGMVKGKIAYLAPEQVLGREVDRRVDVFAVGLSGFLMLTGENPFRTETDFETMSRIVRMPTPLLASVMPGVPQALQPIIERCLQKDAADRYASCAEIARDLEHAAHALGVAETHTGVGSYLQRIAAALDTQRSAEVSENDRGTPIDVRIDRDALLDGLDDAPPPVPQKRTPLVLVAVLLAIGGVALATAMRTAPEGPPALATASIARAPVQIVVPETAKTEAPKEATTVPVAKTPAKAKPVVVKDKDVVVSGVGKIKFAIWPWGLVTIDGKTIGVTPLPPQLLSAGSHRIKIENADLKKSIVRNVKVDANSESVVREDFIPRD